MMGLGATAGVAGEAGPDGEAGHRMTSGAGGRYPSDECGRLVLEWRRQLSMMILASARLEKISPLSGSSRSLELTLSQQPFSQGTPGSM